MRHYARKTDANQAEIVAVWRNLGKIWVDTSRQGDGCPDGFLLHRGIWLAIEFKVSKKARLKPKQRELHTEVDQKGGKIYIICTVTDALDLIGASHGAGS